MYLSIAIITKEDCRHFLYAYVYYLWDGAGPCLILLSIDKESFPKLSEVRTRIEENLSAYKRYPQLKTSISCPDAFTLQEVSQKHRDSTLCMTRLILG